MDTIRILLGMKVGVSFGHSGEPAPGYVMQTLAMQRDIESEQADNFKFKIGLIDADGAIQSTVFWCEASELQVLDRNLTPGITAIHDYYESFD